MEAAAVSSEIVTLGPAECDDAAAPAASGECAGAAAPVAAAAAAGEPNAAIPGDKGDEIELLAAATPTAPLTSATGKLGGVGECRTPAAPPPEEEGSGENGEAGLSPGE